jgi:hypothetical protein
MTHDPYTTDELAQRMARLESKVQELEALANLALRLIAVDNPVGALLKSYGATEAVTRAVHELLDDVANRAAIGGREAPSYAAFQDRLFERFPSMRGNRQFISLLIETLKVDRPAYQKLYQYVVDQWTERPTI